MNQVLVVDDDATMRRSLRRMLERAGFGVEEAADGRTAFARLVEAHATGAPFAVVIVDLEMPGWSGIETIRNAGEVDADLQFVLCTGVDCARLEETLPDAVLVIKKPVERIELIQAARALARKRMLAHQNRLHVDSLEAMLRARVAELEQVNLRLADELAWRDRIEAEMRVVQRLEAVGQLAAGIAHEINTPVQYVGDNLMFLQESTQDLMKLVGQLAAIARREPALAAAADEAVRTCDLDYLRAELPAATESIQHGVHRIAAIVRAIKELTHPGEGIGEADLVRALDSALEVTASAYRHHAEVVRELAPLPPVVCRVGELGQVFLHLIVNAAYAIEATGTRGRLTVRAAVDDDHVHIAISDTGNGIPQDIHHRIFDAFFTTKVGRSTGTGLAIAHTIVVDRHRGSLTFDTSSRGTTFHIRLPIGGAGRWAA